MSSNIYINAANGLCAFGWDLPSIERQLFSGATDSLRVSDVFSPGLPLPLGFVDEEHLASLGHLSSKEFYGRNNQLLLAALAPLREAIEKAKSDYGNERIGVVMGTSTSGIEESTQALRQLDLRGSFPDDYAYLQQTMGCSARFVAEEFQLNGPAWSLSTACTSGSKALVSGARLLRCGLCDVVIAGGADTLSCLTVQGFAALGALSEDVCNPLSINRQGTNIGEGAAVFLLSRTEAPVRLAGWGETTDAYHMSAPHPRGEGASAAMQKALQEAGIDASCIGYINLHGTSTVQNDLVESMATHRVFPHGPLVSSTKPLSGHTLGAAGALEALFCWLTLQRRDGLLPPHLWDGQRDPDLSDLRVVAPSQRYETPDWVMSNSYAFGGNNVSIVLHRS